MDAPGWMAERRAFVCSCAWHSLARRGKQFMRREGLLAYVAIAVAVCSVGRAFADGTPEGEHTKKFRVSEGISQSPRYSPASAQRRAILTGDVDSFRYPGGALVNAVQEHFLDIIVTLLRRPGVLEKEGRDAIRTAIAVNDPEALGVVLAGGVDVNSLEGGGSEALTYAMSPGAGRAICIMADYGVDLSPGSYPKFPLLFALGTDNLQSAQLLRSLGYQPGKQELDLISQRAKKQHVEALWAGIVDSSPSQDTASKICVDMFAVHPQSP